MKDAHHYACHLVWTGAARGGTKRYDGYSREFRVDIDGKPSLPGSADAVFLGDPALHTPEDLLVAALSSCHFLSYAALCARHKIELVTYEDAASGTMQKVGDVIRFTEVILRPKATIAAGDVEAALALHHKAHEQCFIACSVNFEVRHEAVVTELSARG